MVDDKKPLKKKTGAAPKKIASGWTVRGVSQETKDAVALAAKEKGVSVGQWVDDALSEATKAPLGQQLLSSLHDLKDRADPTIDQLRSRTDETLEKWRAGLIEQVGIAAENINRLQQQLRGKPEEKETPLALPDQTNKAKNVGRTSATPSATKAKKKSGAAPTRPRQK